MLADMAGTAAPAVRGSVLPTVSFRHNGDAGIEAGVLNTSSGTDNGVGDYTFSLTNAQVASVFVYPAALGHTSIRRTSFIFESTTTTVRLNYYRDDAISADSGGALIVNGVNT